MDILKLKLYKGELTQGLLPFMDIVNNLSMGEKNAIFNNWLNLGKGKLASFYGWAFFDGNEEAIRELDDLWLRRNYGRIRKR